MGGRVNVVNRGAEAAVRVNVAEAQISLNMNQLRFSIPELASLSWDKSSSASSSSWQLLIVATGNPGATEGVDELAVALVMTMPA